MLIDYQHDADSITLRLKILDSSTTTGAGLTNLTFESAGLVISTIADNEATATAYTQAGSTIETIATLGTYAAPTATKCRFKEVDSTNHPGVYEIQLADARFAVASAKSLLVSISGATNCAETDAVIPLRGVDPFDGVRGGMTALPAAAPDAAGGLLTTTKITDARLTVLTEWIDGGRLDELLDAIPTTKTEYSLSEVGNNAVADAYLNRGNGIETGVTPKQTLQRIGAAVTGKVTGSGTGTELFIGLDGITERVSASVDAIGNRTAITYDP